MAPQGWNGLKKRKTPKSSPLTHRQTQTYLFQAQLDNSREKHEVEEKQSDRGKRKNAQANCILDFFFLTQTIDFFKKNLYRNRYLIPC